MADNPFHFGKKEDSDASPPGAGASDIPSQMTNLGRRLRLLEERYETVRDKLQRGDKGFLDFQKEMNRELRINREEVSDLHRDLEDLKDKMRLIVKELKDCAKSDEVAVLKRYLQMWEPVQFVTQNEIDDIVERKIEEKLR